MTVPEFLLAHNTTQVNANINFPYRININYDETQVPSSQIVEGKLIVGAIGQEGELIGGVGQQGVTPNQGGVSVALEDLVTVKIITGLSVTIGTRENWEGALSEVLDLERVFLVANTVRYTVNGETKKLNIINRSRYTSTSGDSTRDYYYFQITPEIVQETGEDDTPQLLNITFSPHLQDEKYQYNEYNPLISNILGNRISTVIQQSDRLNNGIKPTNLSDILSGSAQPAQIQDSNYTATGWSNARYNGSISNAIDEKGIPSVIVGKLFLGEINSNEAQENLICSRSEADRLYKQLVFTGNEELPTYKGYVSSSYKSNGNISTSSLVIPYTVSGSKLEGIVEIGSILQVGSSVERIRVESIEQESSRFRVTRGYLQTTRAVIGSEEVIRVLEPLRILTIEENSAKFSNSVNNKVYVKETQEILYTDGYGMVYNSSSLCIL